MMCGCRFRHIVAGRAPLAGRDGFSLIEMLIVITILALATSLAVPALQRSPDRLLVETTARRVAGMMRLAKTRAMFGNMQTLVSIDLEERKVTFSDEARLQLPHSVSLDVVAARLERTGASTVGFRFFPDGTSTGGTIVLSLKDTQAKISVNWLMGSMALELSPTRRP
ncbi:MAG: prepilin-type N-terminal cleavage/methylation domain-containing protein [Rhizobiales bacterium]|nr:prepilin-type N-terminal cleavage/methylation domain-containing protein [Hyphomicrobiales bacterium]